MPRIPEETIEEVLASTDIVDLIGAYFPLKRVGTNYRALCPFHREKTPSFNVNPARQTYHCFGCHAGGNAFRFLMEYENVDFPSAVRRLADRAGIVVPEEQFDPLADERSRLRDRLLSLHKDVTEWFHYLLFKKDVAAGARQYLKDRAISMESAREWMLGYAPASSGALQGWAREHGYDESVLIAGGLLSRSEERGDTFSWFRNRLMFPVANDYGDYIAFSGRVLDPEARTAKYINSPETPIFIKGKTFYGLGKTKRDILREGRAIICEGQIDLIACHAAGIGNVVAPLGTAFTPQHAQVLKRHAQEVVLCFDSDPAGVKAVERTFAELARLNVVARVAAMPQGEDPDSFIQNRGADVFIELIDGAKDFFDFQIEHRSETGDLSSLRERVNFAGQVATSVGLIEDKILQDSVIKKVCARLAFPETDFRQLVATEQRRSRSNSEIDRDRDRERDGGRPPAEPLRIDDENLHYLARALLTSNEAREWVAAQESIALLEDIPVSAIVSKLWSGSFNPDEPASLTTFLTTLEPGEEAFLTELLEDGQPPCSLDAVKAALVTLKRKALKRRLEEKSAQLKQPHLNTETILKLQKESLDLKRRLTDIAPSHPENE